MKFQGSKLEIEAPESKTYILHCKMYVFSILEWNFKVPNLKLKPESQKHTFYTIKCMFLAQGLFLKKHVWIMPIVWKHTFYTVKCMFFTILEWYFKIPRLKLKPQSQKHTFYTVKCIFFNFGMKFQDSKPEIEAPESKMYYVFFNFGMKFQGSNPEIEAPQSKTYILHGKMYVFPILEWNFQVPNLKLKPRNQKHTFYTVKCMFFQFWNKISRFQAWSLSPRVKNIHFTL